MMVRIRMMAGVVESSSSSETEEEEHSAKDSGFRSQALDCSDQTLGSHGFDLIVVIMRMIVVIKIMI